MLSIFSLQKRITCTSQVYKTVQRAALRGEGRPPGSWAPALSCHDFPEARRADLAPQTQCDLTPRAGSSQAAVLGPPGDGGGVLCVQGRGVQFTHGDPVTTDQNEPCRGLAR